MYKKLAVFIFLSLMGVIFLELAVFAEGPEIPASRMCMASMSDIYRFEGESVTRNVVMDGVDNTLFHSPDAGWHTAFYIQQDLQLSLSFCLQNLYLTGDCKLL